MGVIRIGSKLLYGLAFALLVCASSGFAETLRVATWSFPASAGAEPRLTEAALALKKLDPDVILLEQVRDWQTCSDLAQALKPAAYTVLVCSAFRPAADAPAAPQQVAILAKHKGYFSWSESWQAEGDSAVPGGFAFAAIRFAKHRVGFFAAQVAPQAAGTDRPAAAQAALSRQWAQTLGSFKSWVANRLEAVVVAGGDFATDSSEGASVIDSLSAPLQSTVTHPARPAPGGAADLVPVSLTADVETLPVLVLLGPQAACAVNLDSPKAPVAQSAPAKAPAAPLKARSGPPAPRPTAAAPHPWPAAAKLYPYIGLGVALAALLGLAWFRARRRRARVAAKPVVLAGQGLSAYTLVVSSSSIAGPTACAGVEPPIPQRVPAQATPGPVEAWPPGPVLLSPELQRVVAQERTALRFHLADWLKQKLVQRLLSDRSQLLKTQQAATQQLLSVEERLARLEQQLQQQNRAYEERILELTSDLESAKEESRALIRARIVQVKAEMANARARLLAHAGVGEE